jgi:hypothetical protein
VQCLCSATMCNQVYQRAALTIFLPVTYKSWVLVLKTINYAPFFELTGILISVPFWLLIGAKWRFKYVCATQRCVIKVFQGQRLIFTRLRYKKIAFSCSKGSNKHHFSGYASSFPRLFGHYSGRNNVANMFVQCHDVSLRLSKGSVNLFLACNIQIKSSRTQKDQLCIIFKLTRILISVPF